MKRPESLIKKSEYDKPQSFENDWEAELYYSYIELQKYIDYLESEVKKLLQHDNMKRRFICWYAYCGHETEGRLDLEEPLIFEAVDEAEAMWKYHENRFKNRRGNDMTQWYKDVDDYRKRCDHITGWGFRCEELKSV